MPLRPFLLLVAAFAVACVGPIGGRRFVALETPHFRVISSAPRSQATDVAEGLELLRAVLARVGLASSLEPRTPLFVYVLRDDAEFERFRTRPGIDSFLVARPDASRIVVHAGPDADPRTAAMHEYVHFVLRNGGATHHPSWYDEGLAEFMSTLHVQGPHVVLGAIPDEHRDWLAHGSPASLRSMMSSDGAAEWSEPARGRFMAQAWALVHFFHLAGRVEMPARQDQMLRYIALRDQGVAPDPAVAAAFDSDFPALEAEFLRYIGRDQLPFLGLPREPLPPSSVDSRILPDGEGERLLGALALALGEPRRDEARAWLQQAVEDAPDDALAAAQLGLALARTDVAASDAQLARSLALAPEDARIHRLHGEALLERAIAAGGDPALARQAGEALERSLALDPEQAAAAASLGRAQWIAAGGEDPAAGLDALRRAHERLPGHTGLALMLAQREASHGSADRARALVTSWTPPSHGEPVPSGERAALLALRDALGLHSEPDPSLQARLDVQAPDPGGTVRGLVGWVEVRGRGGFWDALHHDVVIAIDESESTRGPTGSDVDGDGVVGEAIGPEWIGVASRDPGDSILQAELEAARTLVRQLDAETTRVGLVAFSTEARIIAPLGAPEATLALLDRYREDVVPDGATSLAAGLGGALQLFSEGRSSNVRRQRSVLLVSDGIPTHPTPERGVQAALALSERMGRVGVPIHSFALGRAALDEPGFYEEVAGHSGGEFVPVVEPGDVVSQLAKVHFTGLRDVRVESRPAREPGRAVRVFADGSFSAFAELVEGRNEIAIAASLANGETLTDTLTVHFERPKDPGPADRLAADRLLQEIQNRTLELELISEIRARSGQTRHLELGVEEAGRELPVGAD